MNIPPCFLLIYSSAIAQRAQAQVGDRRQIDDIEANNSRANAATGTIASSRDSVSSDRLGSLPPGWQMSRADNERVFFIDHINKRTTWVKQTKINKGFSTYHNGFCMLRLILEQVNQVFHHRLNVNSVKMDRCQ